MFDTNQFHFAPLFEVQPFCAPHTWRLNLSVLHCKLLSWSVSVYDRKNSKGFVSFQSSLKSCLWGRDKDSRLHAPPANNVNRDLQPHADASCLQYWRDCCQSRSYLSHMVSSSQESSLQLTVQHGLCAASGNNAHVSTESTSLIQTNAALYCSICSVIILLSLKLIVFTYSGLTKLCHHRSYFQGVFISVSIAFIRIFFTLTRAHKRYYNSAIKM